MGYQLLPLCMCLSTFKQQKMRCEQLLSYSNRLGRFILVYELAQIIWRCMEGLFFWSFLIFILFNNASMFQCVQHHFPNPINLPRIIFLWLDFNLAIATHQVFSFKFQSMKRCCNNYVFKRTWNSTLVLEVAQKP